MTLITRALVAAFVLLGPASGLTAQSSTTARTVRFDAPALGSQATFAILLPPDYDTSDKRYPVVYLLHGGTQNHTAFPSRSWFAKEARRRDMIVVMPHVPPFAYSVRGGASPFEQFIAADLVRYVDANYRTRAARDARAIGGLSIGGFGALVAGLKYPHLFGTVGAFSGAFGGDRDRTVAAAVAAADPQTAPFVYLACGLQDPVLQAGRDVVAQLMEKRIAHEYLEVPGGHTWDVWDPQTLAFLDLLTRRPGFATGSTPRP